MSKYTLIEQQLDSINEAKFQQICNAFLQFKYKGCLHSPGTVPAKEKTRKGKPDTFIKTPEGKYILAEVTTQDPKRKASFYKKMEEDVKDCLRFESLGIQPEQVELIVLCCNSIVDPSHYESLQALANPFPLVICGIQQIASFLFAEGRVYAKDFLDIPFDTGQILTKEQFLERYHRSNVSTRLDTTLQGREKEMQELTEAIGSAGLVVIKGLSGVGKSRLALEAIDAFIQKNGEYTPYYIFNKQDIIADDLKTHLDPGRQYLLFIDDANRQILNFLSVLESQLEHTTEQVKIVATVRNYAQEEVLCRCRNLQPLVYELQKLSPETIINIIKGGDVCITDAVLQNRIARISDGNPRLAIMAAMAVKDNSNTEILNDVSTIYDQYFQSIIDEKGIFRDRDYLKVLGLLAYFQAVDLQSDEAGKIFKDFNISYDRFFEIAHQLENMELVEIHLNYTIKISEQVLSTYFFYQIFFKKEILSFPTLLAHYFARHEWLMRDSFYPAATAFGESRMMAKARPVLEAYYTEIKEEEENRQRFLEVFGIYLPLRVFSYVTQYERLLPLENVTIHMLPYLEKRGIYSHHDPVMRLLEPFFSTQQLPHLSAAIDLSIRYLQKKPEIYAPLLQKLKESLSVKAEDAKIGFQRQVTVFNLLESLVGTGLLAKRLFFETFMPVLLEIYFPWEALVKNKAGKWELVQALQQLRGAFWTAIRQQFSQDRDYAHSLLIRYLDHIREYNGFIYHFDAPHIKQIIEQELNPEHFGDCFFVYHYSTKIAKIKLKLPWLTVMASRFHTFTFKVFKSMTWERSEPFSLRKRYTHWSHVEQIKTARILKFIPAASVRDYKKVYNATLEIVNYPHIRKFNEYPLFELYLSGIMKRDPALGFRVLALYLEGGNEVQIHSGTLIKTIATVGVKEYTKLYGLLNRYIFKNKENWLESYFLLLPEQLISRKWIEELIKLYRSAEGLVTVSKQLFIPFLQYDPDLMATVLRILSERRAASKQFVYKIDHQLFKDCPKLVAQHWELCAQVYLQQEDIDEHYDIEGTDFMELYGYNPAMLKRYMNALVVTQPRYYGHHFKPLEKLWQFEESEEEIYETLIELKANDRYSVSDHLANIFFSNLQPEYHERAYRLLEKIITLHYKDSKALNMVFDIARNCLKDRYYELIKLYLILNPDVEMFQQMRWYNSHFSSSGNAIWSDFKAAELRRVQQVVEELAGYAYNEHLLYLEQRIFWEEARSAEERKLQFMGWR